MDYIEMAEIMARFRDDEEWKKSHNTINLSISIVSQAASLLESFKWANNLSPTEVIESRKIEIIEKLAEITTSIIYLGYTLGISQDTMEAFIYSRMIKEYSTLTGQQETSGNITNVRTIDFKHHEK